MPNNCLQNKGVFQRVKGFWMKERCICEFPPGCLYSAFVCLYLQADNTHRPWTIQWAIKSQLVSLLLPLFSLSTIHVHLCVRVVSIYPPVYQSTGASAKSFHGKYRLIMTDVISFISDGTYPLKYACISSDDLQDWLRTLLDQHIVFIILYKPWIFHYYQGSVDEYAFSLN